MKLLAFVAAVAVSSSAASLPFRQTSFESSGSGLPDGWALWAPRDEIAPRVYVDPVHSRQGGTAIALSGNSNAAVYGGVQRIITDIEPGRWYRFRACWRAEGLDDPPRQVVARLDWLGQDNTRTDQPEYAWRTTASGEWNNIVLDAAAPSGARAVALQLMLVNAPHATVWWDEVSLEPIAAPEPRRVTVASINLRPSDTKDPVGDFLAVLAHSLPAKCDLVVLPEGITVVGTGRAYTEVAEPLPGPVTARLGAFARTHHTWLVAGVYEREGVAVYNTAVLIDRSGALVGRYRKVYLPREELEAGLTPGSDYPVFRTDFGTLGIMICWDVQYADPARALALRGAELIAMPIWGGNETLAKARAIENRVFLASSGYDHPTYIMDPDGELLSLAKDRGTLAVATIDLNRRYRDSWLGDMRQRFMKEVRLDVPVRR
ncbi:MAG TPA: carbon-nitrogen hydrolase family protein [Bryobacteraceae bacterium]|nr:carbon-nitrogen hydrolase family protein [Bryobacteraceae bacterium]